MGAITRGQIAGEPAAARDRSPDLCATCRRALTCALPRPAGRPRPRCKRFEADDGRAASPVRAGRSRPVAAAQESAEDWLGLCRTCENRIGCLHARPLGGVWHCEEYR